jgi:DNA-binding NtrC family response regulator
MDVRRILLVDDEESLRLTIAANLELEDFEVVEAASAEEALKLAGAEQFDVVLSDIRMPGLGGVDMFIRLREQNPELPVVLMTAFTTEDEVTRAIESGVFAVLSKPFEIDVAVAALRRALRRPIVLVVDDAHSVAVTTAALLNAMGLRARAVHSGEEALRLVASEQVDVCITDLLMPGMDGVELGRRLRAIDPDMALIVFSGAAQSDELMRSAARSGAHRCLRKPLSPKELAYSVASARKCQL